MKLRILSAAVAAYVLLFFSWCCIKYYTFAYNDFDLAQHAQILWNILHGRIYCSVLGIDFLGNHAHFISFPAALLYALIPHPLFLLFLQTAFLAAGAYPLYGLARKYLDETTSLIISIIYLLYPGLGYTNLFEFHPTCFATFFLLCTAYYFYEENFSLFNVFMFLSLMCQENIPLIFVMWGIYALFLKRSLKWTLWPSALGICYFFLCVQVVLPFFNKNIFDFFSIYAPLGNNVSQLAMTCLQHPVQVLAYMFKPYKIIYLKQLFLGVSFISLLSPLALLPSFLIFLQHLLSNRVTELRLVYHYTAELIPFIFISFIFGVRKLNQWISKPHWLAYVLLLNALLVTFFLGPHFRFLQEWKNLLSDPSISEEQHFLSEVPPRAGVMATFKFLPHLTHHQELYSFHYVSTGFYTLSRKHFLLPDTVQYGLVDFNDFRTFTGFYPSFNYRNLTPFMPGGRWGVLDVKDSIVLFKKGVHDQYPLFNFVNRMDPEHPLDLVVDGHIKLAGYNIQELPGRINLELYWQTLQPESKDINLFIDFIGQDGKVIDRQYRPLCYRIWPTRAWVKGQLIKEHQYILLSPKVKGHLKTLAIGFFDFPARKIVETNSSDDLGRIEIPYYSQK